MYFTGELMYVKTKTGRKEIRKGDSLKDILSDERIAALARMKPPRASAKNPLAVSNSGSSEVGKAAEKASAEKEGKAK